MCPANVAIKDSIPSLKLLRDLLNKRISTQRETNPFSYLSGSDLWCPITVKSIYRLDHSVIELLAIINAEESVWVSVSSDRRIGGNKIDTGYPTMRYDDREVLVVRCGYRDGVIDGDRDGVNCNIYFSNNGIGNYHSKSICLIQEFD